MQDPGTLYVLGNNSTYNQLQNGREVTFDHINFVLTNHLNVSTSGGGLYAYGKLTVKGGHVEVLYDNANITVSSTGSLIIDEGANVCTRYFGVDASSTLDIRNGTFLFTGCSVNDVVTPNLHVGANSKLLCVGTTASIVQTPYNASNDGCWPAFTSLAETPPTANLSLKTMPSGYSLRWIAGSAFYANGVDITQPYGYWLDTGSDCYFSNTSNWGRATLYKSGTVNMSLSAKNHAVMTNDVDGVAVLSLLMSVEHAGYQASAPMFRGNCLEYDLPSKWRQCPENNFQIFRHTLSHGNGTIM